jgi:hypothetical protein
MLLNFLLSRGVDLRSAGERDIQEFRLWRREEAEVTVTEATGDRDAAAIGVCTSSWSRSAVWMAVPGGRGGADRCLQAASALTYAFDTWSWSSTCTADTSGSAGWRRMRVWMGPFGDGGRPATGRPASSR